MLSEFSLRRFVALTALAGVGLLTGACASASRIGDMAGRAAEQATGREVADRVDRGVSATADAAEDAVTGEGGSSAGTAAGSRGAGTAASATPGGDGEGSGSGIADAEAWANYDFVPGDEVLFADDFSGENVGDFPRRLDYVRGTMEVVEIQGRRLLRATGSNSRFSVPLPKTLPEKFTIEFDVHDPATEGGTLVSTAEPSERHRVSGQHFNFGHWRGSGLWIGGDPTSVVESDGLIEEVLTARIMVDGAHAKAFLNEQRIANVPQVEMDRTNRLHFLMRARDDRPIYIGNIRIAGGGRDLYDKLAEDGRVTTRGILFDVDSDRIRPESNPTLEEIGTMLQDHPDLRISIEGHTDSSGADQYNLELSQRRADAVRAHLLASFGIDGDRLEAVGKGEAEPVDSNDTAEGRQKNRRVELVKIG